MSMPDGSVAEGGAPASAHTGGSGGGSTPAHGEGADPNVYNDQEGVGEGTLAGSNEHNHSAVGVSTARGGTIEVGREFELGRVDAPPMPIPGVPGLFMTITGGVKAAASVAVSGLVAGESEREYQVSVTGTLQAGIEAGMPPLASMYLRCGPVIRASARAAFDSEGLKSVNADVSLDSTISVGVQGGSGAVDYNILLARANIGRFVGVHYERGRPLQRGTFQMGSALIQAGRDAKAAYDSVLSIAQAGQEALRHPGRTISRAWNWVTG